MNPPVHPALYDYPERARLGRGVPKNRIVVSGKPSRRVRDQLTAQVGKIVWQYKLAPETLNLAATKAVPEIQVFSLVLKPAGVGDKLPEEVLRCIDRAIGFPIVFELIARQEDGAAANRIRAAATYKRPSEGDRSKWVIGDYYATDWLPADTPRDPLPVALDLARLYEQMLRRLIPLPARDGETIAALAERHREATVKRRECERLQARLHREKQFNRKVELNRQLRERQVELDALTGSSNEGQTHHG